MVTTQKHPDPLPESVEKGYEEHDLKGSWIVWFMVIFILGGIAIHAGLWYLLVEMGSHRRDVDQPQSAFSAENVPVPQPLQPTQQHDRLPPQDLQAMHQREDSIFQQLGWQVDTKTHDVT